MAPRAARRGIGSSGGRVVAGSWPTTARTSASGSGRAGLLCRGFARLRCATCDQSRLVAWSCKGRGFCSSCTGRRMCATAANLTPHVLPEAALRQWVLTFPFAWRGRLAHDGALLSALTRIFVETVCAFYAERAAAKGGDGAKTGAVTVVQRTSSDLRLHPHLHVVFLDGAYHEQGDALVWEQLGHLQSREVGRVLERGLRRMARYLRRHGALEPAGNADEDAADAEDAGAATDAPERRLAACAVSGQTPPAGPQWQRGISPRSPRALAYDKPLCASIDGFTLHAASPSSHLFGGESGGVHRADGPRNAARRKDGQCALQPARRDDELQARHARHPHVGDEQIDGPRLQLSQRGRALVERHHHVVGAHLRQPVRDRPDQRLSRIDQSDLHGAGSSPGLSFEPTQFGTMAVNAP